MSRHQPMISLSTDEAEYVAAYISSMGAIPEYNILQGILMDRKITWCMGINNQAAYTMKTSPTYIRRTRPIVLRWQYAREQVEKGRIMRQKVKGDDNQPEIFTKPLDGITFGFYFVYPE